MIYVVKSDMGENLKCFNVKAFLDQQEAEEFKDECNAYLATRPSWYGLPVESWEKFTFRKIEWYDAAPFNKENSEALKFEVEAL